MSGATSSLRVVGGGTDRGRVPAHDLDAERLVLGWAMIDSASADRARGLVRAEDFFATEYAAAWRSLVALRERGEACPPEAVLDHMRGGAGKAALSLEQLEALMRVVDGSEVSVAARIVRRCSVQRRAGTRLRAATVASYGPIPDRAAWLDEIILDLGSLRAECEADTAVAIGASVDDVLRVALARDVNRALAGTSTGLRDLDDRTSGLHGGEMAVLTAKTGGGKSALAMQIATTVAAGGVPARVVSLEMPHKQLTMRALCSLAGVNWHDARSGRMTRDDQLRLCEIGTSTRQLPISYSAERRLGELDHAIRTFGALHATGLVVVDYVQLVDGRAAVDRHASREGEMAQVARTLARAARDTGLMLLVCAQLNDDGQVRESRAIAHEATSWWDLELSDDRGPRTATVKIRKQRHGPAPTEAQFWFVPHLLRFQDDRPPEAIPENHWTENADDA